MYLLGRSMAFRMGQGCCCVASRYALGFEGGGGRGFLEVVRAEQGETAEKLRWDMDTCDRVRVGRMKDERHDG